MTNQIRTNRAWSKKEITFLTKNNRKSAQWIADQLDRTVISINSKRYALKGRDLENAGKEWSPRELKFMAKNMGKTNEVLSSKMQRSPKEINAIRFRLKRSVSL